MPLILLPLLPRQRQGALLPDPAGGPADDRHLPGEVREAEFGGEGALLLGSNVATVNLTEIDTTSSLLKHHYLMKNTCFSYKYAKNIRFLYKYAKNTSFL